MYFHITTKDIDDTLSYKVKYVNYFEAFVSLVYTVFKNNEL